LEFPYIEYLYPGSAHEPPTRVVDVLVVEETLVVDVVVPFTGAVVVVLSVVGEVVGTIWVVVGSRSSQELMSKDPMLLPTTR